MDIVFAAKALDSLCLQNIVNSVGGSMIYV